MTSSTTTNTPTEPFRPVATADNDPARWPRGWNDDPQPWQRDTDPTFYVHPQLRPWYRRTERSEAEALAMIQANEGRWLLPGDPLLLLGTRGKPVSCSDATPQLIESFQSWWHKWQAAKRYMAERDRQAQAVRDRAHTCCCCGEVSSTTVPRLRLNPTLPTERPAVLVPRELAVSSPLVCDPCYPLMIEEQAALLAQRARQLGDQVLADGRTRRAHAQTAMQRIGV